MLWSDILHTTNYISADLEIIQMNVNIQEQNDDRNKCILLQMFILELALMWSPQKLFSENAHPPYATCTWRTINRS